MPGPIAAPFDPPRHRGVDLAAPAGTPVVAPVAGTVAFAGLVAGHQWVTVRQGDSVLVSVGFLATTAVVPRQVVAAGDTVGVAEGTAHDDGSPGIHLSVRVGGTYVDPTPLLGDAAAVPHARLIPEGTTPARDALTPEDVLDGLDAFVHRLRQVASGLAALATRATARGTAAAGDGDGPDYVAFGDSITTGFSVSTCCGGRPPAEPYPEIVARRGGAAVDDLDRVGIWGYTLAEAAAQPATQLDHVRRARHLVTGALGINDTHFSDLLAWLRAAFDGVVETRARGIVAAVQPSFDALFAALGEAARRGARVVVTLYYNPYDSPACSPVNGIADTIVSVVNEELAGRAASAGFVVADFHTAFRGHGPGSGDSWVFATRCTPAGLVRSALVSVRWWCLLCEVLDGGDRIGEAVAADFDPHPNAAGTAAMAGAVLAVIR